MNSVWINKRKQLINHWKRHIHDLWKQGRQGRHLQCTDWLTTHLRQDIMDMQTASEMKTTETQQPKQKIRYILKWKIMDRGRAYKPSGNKLTCRPKSAPLKNFTVCSIVIILKIYNANSGFVTGKKNQNDWIRTERGVAIWNKCDFYPEILTSGFSQKHYMPSFSSKNSEWSNKNWRRSSVL